MEMLVFLALQSLQVSTAAAPREQLQDLSAGCKALLLPARAGPCSTGSDQRGLRQTVPRGGLRPGAAGPAGLCSSLRWQACREGCHLGEPSTCIIPGIPPAVCRR